MATDASDWEQQRQELDAEPWDWVSSELAPLPLASIPGAGIELRSAWAGGVSGVGSGSGACGCPTRGWGR